MTRVRADKMKRVKTPYRCGTRCATATTLRNTAFDRTRTRAIPGNRFARAARCRLAGSRTRLQYNQNGNRNVHDKIERRIPVWSKIWIHSIGYCSHLDSIQRQKTPRSWTWTCRNRIHPTTWSDDIRPKVMRNEPEWNSFEPWPWRP